MPATHLISVDFPAPLSPTSAITSPSRTEKSTSESACTDPKLSERRRSSRVGVVSLTGAGVLSGWGRPRRRPHRASNRLLAELLVGADAHLALLHEPVLEEELVVLLRDPLRDEQDRRRSTDLRVRLHLLALEDRDRSVRRGRRLELHRLVDGARLPAGDDVLHPRRGRILAGQRDRLQPFVLQRGDDRTSETVVCRKHAVDLVVIPSEHLLEDRLGLDRIPVGPLVSGGCLL